MWATPSRACGCWRSRAPMPSTSSPRATKVRRSHDATRNIIETCSKQPRGRRLRMTGARPNAPDIDNIRAALTWAFAPGGDKWIGVALAAASAPIWLEMSLLTECHGWMGKALDHLDAADRGTRREMVLQTELGLSLMFTQGTSSR